MPYDLVVKNGTIVDGHTHMDAQIFWEGMAADLLVFDPETVLLRDGKHTGALPGQLLRGRPGRP